MNPRPLEQVSVVLDLALLLAISMSDELDDRTYYPCIHKSAWRLLADSERSAARILGYTESLWNRGDAIGLFAQDWFELDPSYRRAAMALGYNRDLWLVEPWLGHKKQYWMLLRQDERRTARVLGYEAATWEGGGETEACSRPWDALVADDATSSRPRCSSATRARRGGKSARRWRRPSAG